MRKAALPLTASISEHLCMLPPYAAAGRSWPQWTSITVRPSECLPLKNNQRNSNECTE